MPEASQTETGDKTKERKPAKLGKTKVKRKQQVNVRASEEDPADGQASLSDSSSQSEPQTPPPRPAKRPQSRAPKFRSDMEDEEQPRRRTSKTMTKDDDKEALLDNRADRFNMLTNNPATQLSQNKKGGEYGYEGGGSNQAPPLIVASVNAYVYLEAKVNANVTINICAPATKAAEPPKWAD